MAVRLVSWLSVHNFLGPSFSERCVYVIAGLPARLIELSEVKLHPGGLSAQYLLAPPFMLIFHCGHGSSDWVGKVCIALNFKSCLKIHFKHIRVDFVGLATVDKLFLRGELLGHRLRPLTQSLLHFS